MILGISYIHTKREKCFNWKQPDLERKIVSQRCNQNNNNNVIKFLENKILWKMNIPNPKWEISYSSIHSGQLYV